MGGVKKMRQPIEQLAGKKRLKIEDVERLREELTIKRNRSKDKITITAQRVRNRFTPSIGILSLFSKKREKKKNLNKLNSQKKNSFSIIKGLFTGYKIAKGWRRFFKKK